MLLQVTPHRFSFMQAWHMAKPQRQVQQNINSFTQQWHSTGCFALPHPALDLCLIFSSIAFVFGQTLICYRCWGLLPMILEISLLPAPFKLPGKTAHLWLVIRNIIAGTGQKSQQETKPVFL
jgi:hypothetical protein